MATSCALYYHPISICSLMSRFVISIRGEPKDVDSEIEVTEQLVDIFTGEQLSEKYLTEINPKGQVPVLVGADGSPAPISDSLKIAFYLAEKYPSLIPEQHSQEITHLLQKLAEINYFSLGHKPTVPELFKSLVEQKLAQPNLSARYRDALEFKQNITMNEKVHSVTADAIAKEEARAKALFAELEPILARSTRPWLFGDRPTAIDAHLVVFLKRMVDVNRTSMIPDSLRSYFETALSSEAWEKFSKKI